MPKMIEIGQCLTGLFKK